MLWTIYTYLNFALVLLTAEFVICLRFPRRKHWLLRFLLGCIPSLVLSCVWTRPPRSPYTFLYSFHYLSVFLLTGAAMVLAFKGDFWTYLFAGIMAYCGQHISYQLYRLLDMLLKNPFGRWGEVFLLLLTAAVIGGLYLVFTRRLKKGETFVVNNKYQVILSALVLVVTVFVSFWGAIRYFNAIYVVCIFSIITCFLAVFLEISFLDLKKNETELAVLRHMVHAAKRQFDESKENIDIINVKCHDLRYQISGLKGRVDEEELHKLSDAINIYDSDFKTGSDALDIVLTEKSLLCTRKNIRLTCMLNGKNLNHFSPSDVYSLFGNAIDNAIESVERLPDEKKVISISEISRTGLSVIRIENYFAGEITFGEGLPISPKDRNYHGFGVKSIKMIAEKYGGEIAFSINDDIFRLDVFLLVPRT